VIFLTSELYITMSHVQITCTKKSVPNGGHEHITHAGNPSGNWEWTVPQIVQSIDNKTNTFYVSDPRTGKQANVGVVRPAGRPAHIRTYADGIWTDNLLSLTTCPLRRAA